MRNGSFIHPDSKWLLLVSKNKILFVDLSLSPSSEPLGGCWKVDLTLTQVPACWQWHAAPAELEWVKKSQSDLWVKSLVAFSEPPA